MGGSPHPAGEEVLKRAFGAFFLRNFAEMCRILSKKCKEEDLLIAEKAVQ